MITLEQILTTKRGEIEARKSAVPVEALKERIAELGRPRNFFAAVVANPEKATPRRRLNLIAEVKKASPSAGLIREDFDPVAIAKVYADAGASALSVLTDEPYFQGKLDYIHAIRDAVKLPVLRKDFILDQYQVYESRAAGADAILLIGEALRTNELIDLQILATELNMTCLIEVHRLETLMRIQDTVIGFPHQAYSLLGINNRDLATMTTDLGTTLRLLEFVVDRGILVSESGIRTADDAKRLVDAGVQSVLVGESLMRSGDMAGTIRSLIGAK